MNLEIRKIDKICHILAVCYIALPFLIFVIGWLRWYISVPVVVLVAFAVFQFLHFNNVVHCNGLCKKNLPLILGIIAIVFFWVYLSGIGGFVYQNTDHGARNAIFRVLVSEQWPVNIEMADGTSRSLIYYIGFWLPASVVGKIWGIQAGFCFQALWAVLGICLVLYYIFTIYKKVSIGPLLLLVFFSGLDCVGGYLAGNVYKFYEHLEWWANPYQYSSMTTQLFWVFNQALPIWLIIMLMYVQKQNRYIVLILSLAMLPSTIPFVGAIPFAIYFMVKNIWQYRRSNTDKRWIRDVFSYANVVGGGLIGLISFGYLIGNQSGNNLASSSQAISNNDYNASLMIYVMFILLEVGIYILFLYKYQKKNPLFYIIIGCLLIIPLFRVGYGSDFCMRASIPALILLMLMCLQSYTEALKNKKYIYIGALTAVLIIGAITPLHEINRAINKTIYYQRNGKNIWAEESNKEELLNSSNFSGVIDNNIFYKYFCK